MTGVQTCALPIYGKPVVRDSKILTLNEAQILAKAAEYAAKVTASLK